MESFEKIPKCQNKSRMNQLLRKREQSTQTFSDGRKVGKKIETENGKCG